MMRRTAVRPVRVDTAAGGRLRSGRQPRPDDGTARCRAHHAARRHPADECARSPRAAHCRAGCARADARADAAAGLRQRPGRGKGSTLRMLYWQAPTILNTHLSQGTKDYDAGRLILEPLAAIGPDGSLVPELAAEIPTLDNGGVSKDNTSITWKLRPDVKWSDGTDFTADDVVFTWQYVSNPD